MPVITHNDLPSAVGQILNRLTSIEQFLLNKRNDAPNDADELLTVPDAAKFLKLSVPTIYGLISKGQLPVMKRSKRCYFSKEELLNYLKQGRKKTRAEIEAEADSFFKKPLKAR